MENRIMNEIIKRAKEVTAKWNAEKNDKKRLAMMAEANRRVQVREFDNMLCLSLDGVPVMPMREFNQQVLSDARLTLYNYLNRE